MRTTDFESAIDALGVDIVKDEVFLRGGQVTKFYGHKEQLLLRWDHMGRAFSRLPVFKLSMDSPATVHRNFRASDYEHEPVYDLKFE